MSFDPNIPQANDIISDSQGDLLTNFTQLNTIFGEDHVALNAGADQGKHKKVTFVSLGDTPADDAPETVENEFTLFALKKATELTEIYARREGEDIENIQQFTKGGELFIRLHPVFAVNWLDPTPSADITPGNANVTIQSSFNYASTSRLTASKCHYAFNFTNNVLDSSGNPTNNYIWTIQGFDSSTNPVVGNVESGANYATVVGSNFIKIDFKNQDGTVVTDLTGGSIMCWRFQ